MFEYHKLSEVDEVKVYGNAVCHIFIEMGSNVSESRMCLPDRQQYQGGISLNKYVRTNHFLQVFSVRRFGSCMSLYQVKGKDINLRALITTSKPTYILSTQ